MNEIIQGKTLVGTVVNAINNSKVYGSLGLKNMYLLSLVGDLLINFKGLSFDQRQRLETLYNFIKYNDKDICNYKQKDLTSYKKVNYCKDCANNLTLKYNTSVPTVDDQSVWVDGVYDFVLEDFTQNFNDPQGGGPQTVRLNSIPFVGEGYPPPALLTFDGEPIWEAGFEFDLADISKLKYTVYDFPGYIDVEFNFQTSNNNINKTFSNMATFTLNIQSAVNQPPSAVGDNSVTINNGATRIFTIADFTTNTTPAYTDPEGDAPANLKILTLPDDGTLQVNGVTATVNQIVPFTGTTSIESGALRYIAAQNSPGADIEMFTFEISDSGSNIYVG